MMAASLLTIGIDARELLGEPTGVGRYLGELLRRWTARPDAASRRLIRYTPEPLPFLRTVGNREREGGRRRKRPRHLVGADPPPARSRADPPDVFFAGAYTAPLALGVPLAVTIHDVSFAARPAGSARARARDAGS